MWTYWKLEVNQSSYLNITLKQKMFFSGQRGQQVILLHNNYCPHVTNAMQLMIMALSFYMWHILHTCPQIFICLHPCNSFCLVSSSKNFKVLKNSLNKTSNQIFLWNIYPHFLHIPLMKSKFPTTVAMWNGLPWGCFPDHYHLNHYLSFISPQYATPVASLHHTSTFNNLLPRVALRYHIGWKNNGKKKEKKRNII